MLPPPDIYSNLRPFFKANPQGTYYGPERDSTLVESHAILLVGYSNEDQRWWVGAGAGGTGGGHPLALWLRPGEASMRRSAHRR